MTNIRKQIDKMELMLDGLVLTNNIDRYINHYITKMYTFFNTYILEYDTNYNLYHRLETLNGYCLCILEECKNEEIYNKTIHIMNKIHKIQMAMIN